MALKIADNFSYKGRKPLDERLVVDTLPDLLALASSIIYDGIIVYVKQEYKFYVYDSNNSVDPQLQLWRELKTAGDLISNCTVDTTPTSATYGHLFITLDNGQNIDCGNVIGPKGDQGEGFAIAKEYASVSDMTSDVSPVDDGKMVAVIYTDPVTTQLVADIYIRNSNEPGGTGKNEPGYTYFCNLADATTIQGPQGIQGPKGDKGDAPVITLTPIPATLTSPAGTKVTITVGTDPATQTTVNYSVYNGKDGVGISTIQINAQNHLIITMTDASTYDLGVIGSGVGGGCITILGCFSQAPTTFAQGDIYYNTTDNKLYKATSGTAWDTGSTPVEDILYISIDDKMIYAYTQHTWTIYGGTGVSQEPNNAIQQKTDGLYVKDSATLVQNLVTKKYANATPKYLYATSVQQSQFNVSPYDSWLNHLPDIKTTLELTDDNWIILTEGTWLLEADTITGSTSGGTGESAFWFIDRANNGLTSKGYSAAGASSDYDVTTRGVVTVKPGDTLEVTVVFNHIHSIESSYTSVMVHEIGGIVGDPLEHIDLTQGIEDVPVGHTIVCTATSAPKHYLACDGSIYKIADYPDLAGHFIKEFGMANVFGGDGVETFAVPSSPIESYESVMQPIDASQGDDYHCVSEGEYGPDPGHHDYYAFDGRNDTFYLSSNTETPYIGIVFDQPKAVCKYTLLSRNKDANDTTVFPKDFIFQGTNDDDVWEDIDTQTGVICTGRYQLFEFNLKKPVVYRGYRIYCTANNGYREPIIGVAEFGLYMYTQIECIKYEPTYFIGTINGAKPVVEDISGDYTLTGDDVTVGTHDFLHDERVINLSKPLSNFDEIEIETYNVSNGKRRMTDMKRYFVNEIVMHDSSDGEFDDCYVFNNINMSSELKLVGYSLYLVFTDDSTIKVMYLARTGITLDSIVIKVRGIRSDYSIQ